MLKRALKWTGIGLVAMGVLLVVVLLVMWGLSANRLNKTYTVEASFSLDVPDDGERIAAGERVYSIQCASCHGDNLAGEEFSNDLLFGRIYTANLTSGEGGVGNFYTEEDYVRAVWYGVKPDGSPTVGMPWELHNSIHVTDMENLIAYILSAEPVDTDYPGQRFGPILRVLHVTGLFPLVTAEKVDMDSLPPVVVSAEDTLGDGEYLTVICTACHGEDFGGNSFAGGPNLTSHPSALGDWTEAEFALAVREGQRPDGSTIDAEQMPWESFSHYSDEEISAMWAYLRSVDPISN